MDNNKNSNSPANNNQGRLHVLGIDAEIDPASGRKLKRGIYAADRSHMLVMGLPRYDKTCFILSQIKQHIDHDEGFMVFDSHGDLAQLVLSHIPTEQWDKVVYINPWSAFQDKYNNQVVQINFLEASHPSEQSTVARMFTDTFEKIYTNCWSVSLEDALLNTLYLLREKEKPTLSDLCRVLSDRALRYLLVSRCRNESIRIFWEKQYDKLNDEALSILTKLYRHCEDPTLAPMFRPTKSNINFRQIIDDKKIVIVDLPEKSIPADATTFLGSLILSVVCNAGLSRRDVPMQERKPFYIYIDEAYHYITRNMPKILKELQHFKVFVTLAAQCFEQYHRSVQLSLTQPFETFVSFQVDQKTAQSLERFYPEQYGYQTLMNLPPHRFFASTTFGMKREHQIIETLDYKMGSHKPEEVICYSLDKYGCRVDVEALMWQRGQLLHQEFLDNPINFVEWDTLLIIRQQDITMDEKTLKKQFLYNSPINSKLTETNLELSNQTPTKPALENNDSSEYKTAVLSFEGLEKERLMLKLADEGWYFRLKEVKNKKYLCVRKSKEEHSLGPYTNEIKCIAEKNKIQIKK
ncbi:MAG: type IV secretion system DNA-binding domain-containing protein [Candidatus Bathyarchaeota archaeon]|nr:type IV secretion system DNA-binding domain-containing protein [Candidatus Termiticorpusculum sp.]